MHITHFIQLRRTLAIIHPDQLQVLTWLKLAKITTSLVYVSKRYTQRAHSSLTVVYQEIYRVSLPLSVSLQLSKGLPKAFELVLPRRDLHPLEMTVCDQ